jgi:hypothetical protein
MPSTGSAAAFSGDADRKRTSRLEVVLAAYSAERSR